MARLADIIKSFRANVREGNPCEIRFDGKTVQLYPFDVGQGNKVWLRTHIGIVTKVSKPKEDWSDLQIFPG